MQYLLRGNSPVFHIPSKLVSSPLQKLSTMYGDTFEIDSDDNSSLATPPPPPPADDYIVHRYNEQLKAFRAMAETDLDDESVELPPPPPGMREPKYVLRRPELRFCGKRSRIYALCALFMLVSITIVLAIGFGTGAFVKKEEVGSHRAERVRKYLVSVAYSGKDTFIDPVSPESKALLWLQEEDPLALDPVESESHVRLDQRFALLSLWFQSNYDWFRDDNWLSEDECTWTGVTCEALSPNLRRNLQKGAFVVTGLNLEANNLQGKIPTDIALLQYLVTLNLSKNQLQGEIPGSIQKLEALEEVNLGTNRFNGGLQNIDFTLLGNLETVDFSNNALSGSIPDSFWTLRSLKRLVLDNNSLTGSVPGEISNLQFLGKDLSALDLCSITHISTDYFFHNRTI